MTNPIILNQDDYGYTISVTLKKYDDPDSAEDLSTVTTATLDITRLNETPIINDASCSTAANGVISFTPGSTWFSSATLNNLNHYQAIFKLNYSNGIKHSYKIPVYFHLH